MPFRAILRTLVDVHAPVRGAIFCDYEGERVDAACGAGLTPFDLDVRGATYAKIAADVPTGGRLRVVEDENTIWLLVVDRGYYLVVVCEPARDFEIHSDLVAAALAILAHM